MLVFVALSACGGKPAAGNAYAFTAPTPTTHLKFNILTGAHAVDCALCHGGSSSFTQYDCLGCHTQSPTDAVHTTVTGPAPAGYTYVNTECYRCHADTAAHPYDHPGVTTCAGCHDVGNFYAALPVAGFTHEPMNGQDCSKCHAPTTWLNARAPAGLVADPLAAVKVVALVARYSGTTIAQLTAQNELLSMPMDHASTQVNVASLACSVCHADASLGIFYPGLLHSSLNNHSQPAPTGCGDCHSTSMPTGFVGPTATSPARTPPSGEMKHDAVLWAADLPTATRAVTADCGACHLGPVAALAASWSTAKAGTSPARYHQALTDAGLPQPASCVDCHANSRPTGVVAVTSANVLPGLTFNHASATGDCAACHSRSTSVWSGASFHLAGGAAPTSCLPCHAGQRPTSPTPSGWVSTSYTARPFDYGTNTAGVTHGDGQDCATCHTGASPGGLWPVPRNFSGGLFVHGPATVSASTCVACHMSQRPDLVLGAGPASTQLGFDHSLLGAGDCIGCHQATVTAGSYVNYYAPGTTTLKGGDWQGGSGYPGNVLVSAVNQFVTVTVITLQRATPGGLVTGMTSIQDTLNNAMLHTSSQVPAAISPGTSSTGDTTKCAYCHAVSAQGVLSLPDGQFHSALTAFPTGLGGPLPQPTSGCADCHSVMRPPGLVERGGSDLRPMDHLAAFTGGVPVSDVSKLDCSTCHKSTAGTTWADGVFHTSIGSAVPADCVACHYPLMADSAKANLASGTLYAMSHASSQLTSQACATCHTAALTASTAATPASTAWSPGTYHASLPAKPSACIDCHLVSEPAANASTQSGWTYPLPNGSNDGQWMNHGAALVAGLDCASCHVSDLNSVPLAWSKLDLFHVTGRTPTACQGCHGLTNGNGAVVGTGNNMPSGLTASNTLTTASANSLTGVPAGTFDQITHADVNASVPNCNFCHTQVGRSTVAGIQGKEWAQARFHASFTTSSPLTINGTTGRCSNCHMNVKPGTGYTAQDHSAFTNVSGSQDCSACHSWPGAGGTTSPNWKGGGNMPQYITVGGFAIPNPPATTATTQTGIAKLPHPTPATGMACTSCHAGGTGGKNAIGYDHASALINAACSACHETGSNLLGTAWNGATVQASGAGDTRPNSLTALKATRGTGNGSCNLTITNHFYPTQCGECHVVPTGTGAVTTGATYTSAWSFPHTTSKMTNPTTCNKCHTGQNCGT